MVGGSTKRVRKHRERIKGTKEGAAKVKATNRIYAARSRRKKQIVKLTLQKKGLADSFSINEQQLLGERWQEYMSRFLEKNCNNRVLDGDEQQAVDIAVLKYEVVELEKMIEDKTAREKSWVEAYEEQKEQWCTTSGVLKEECNDGVLDNDEQKNMDKCERKDLERKVEEKNVTEISQIKMEGQEKKKITSPPVAHYPGNKKDNDLSKVLGQQKVNIAKLDKVNERQIKSKEIEEEKDCSAPQADHYPCDEEDSDLSMYDDFPTLPELLPQDNSHGNDLPAVDLFPIEPIPGGSLPFLRKS